MTPADIINAARGILNDRDAVNYRYSDADLLEYVNDAVRATATLRPDLYLTVGDYTCVGGQCEQSLNFEDALALKEVLCIHGGNALLPFNIAEMDAFNPGWRDDPAGPAVQWAKLADDPLRFYVYPKAPASQVIDVRYIRAPVKYAVHDMMVDIPVAFMPAFVDYVVGMAETRDDDHVVSQRSAQFLKQFAARLGAKTTV